MMTVSAAQPDFASTDSQTGQRIMSVDVLRGFDMFWIVGADSLVYALDRMTQKPATQFLAYQLDHAEWQGFHFYDLIFPLFLFIVGVSLVFSLAKTKPARNVSVLARIVRRSVLIFLLGIFYSGGLTNPWPDIRLMGVLNRIALAYFFTALLFHFFKPRVLVAVSIGLLAGYWALLTFVPIRDVRLTKNDLAALAEKSGDMEAAKILSAPGNFSAVENSPAWSAAEKLFYSATHHVTGRFDKGYNLADHLDFRYLRGRKYDTFFDPEGLLSTLSAIVTCLLGTFAGRLLKNQSISGRDKVICLVCSGVVAALLGWLWHLQMPVIKKIWTPSYVLVAGGYSAILLGLFYLIVDVWRIRKWSQPFLWMGMNSITIYIAASLVGGFRRPAARLAGGNVSLFFDHRFANGAGELMVSILGLLLAFWLVHFLYRRKIFLRL
jgi:predicted acyltransferase